MANIKWQCTNHVHIHHYIYRFTMSKSITKFFSIYSHTTPQNFLGAVARKLNLTNHDIKQIMTIHIETLANRRYHLRTHIKSSEIIKKLKQASEKTKEGTSYVLKLESYSVLFQTPDIINETFYIKDIGKGRNNEKDLMLKTMPNQNIYDILNLLWKWNFDEIEYISVNRTHSFIGFKDHRMAKSAKKKLMKENREVTYSTTSMRINRNQSSSNKNITDARNKINKKKHSRVSTNSQSRYSNSSNRRISSNNQPQTPTLVENISTSTMMVSPNTQTGIHSGSSLMSLVPFHQSVPNQMQVYSPINQFGSGQFIQYPSYPMQASLPIQLFNNNLQNPNYQKYEMILLPKPNNYPQFP